MALGKIKADTLEHSTAGSLDTSYVVNGSAKAWGRVSLGGQTLKSSLNVSGITDIGVGQTEWTLISSFSDTSYNPVVSSDNSSGASPARFGGRDGSQATGSYRGICSTTSNGETDGSLFSCVFGDLA